MIWTWRNDPDVRKASFSTAEISWQEHVDWFNEKLSDPACLILVASGADGLPFGQVRFDWPESGEAQIGVTLFREKRGLGLGAPLIRQASQEAFRSAPIKSVHAYIKRENTASIQSFKKAGFSDVDEVEMKGQAARHLVLRRELPILR